MTQMIHEPNLVAPAVASDSLPRPRTGIVFVPCAVCLAPLDLALICDENQPQLCDQHRATDSFPLH